MNTINDAVTMRLRREPDDVQQVGAGFRAESRSGTLYEVATGDTLPLKVLRTPGEESHEQGVTELECDTVVVAHFGLRQVLLALMVNPCGWSVELHSTRITPLGSPQPA